MILSDGGDKESLDTEVSVKLTISRTKSYVLVIALAGILFCISNLLVSDYYVI